MKIKFKIIYLIYLLPAIIFGYLFWQNTKPVLEVKCDVGGKTPLCGELVPTARVAAGVIKEEPVYFDVRLPRKYDTVEAEIKYSDLRTDIFEFGVARDEAKKNFDFTAVENKILDNLGWQKIEKDGLALYQRQPAYKNIADFLANPPKFSETLVYRADLAPKFGKMPAKGNTVIDFPVRENIKLLVYKEGAAPKITVDFSVIPASPSVIPAKLALDRDRGAGIQSNSDEIPYQVRNDKIGENLYRINLSGAKETVFKKISIDSPYVAIADGIKIGELARQIKIFTPSSRLLAQTETAAGVQKILNLDISKPFEQYAVNFGDRSVKTITVPKGNIELGGTLFFVSDKNIFYPKYESFYSGADLSKIYPVKSPQAGSQSEFNRVNFILAEYTSPTAVIASPSACPAKLSVIQERSGEGVAIPAFAGTVSKTVGIASSGTPRNDGSLKTAHIVFNIAGTPTPGGKLRFIFSLPNAPKGELVKIESMKLEFRGKKFSFSDVFQKVLKLVIRN